jgi:SAM-dependent methyltransferase
MTYQSSSHYDQSYFDWQRTIGEFGGWANRTKFSDHIDPSHTVLDFGCGAGFLLKGLQCARRIGVEINPAAAAVARDHGVETYATADDVPDEVADVIISNHALEHVFRPLDELKSLYRKLKPGGTIVIVVPCESASSKYVPNDINHHLYSWSPMCLGNLFSEAGFSLLESKAYRHTWPPGYRQIARLGRPAFDAACRVYGFLRRDRSQSRAVGRKASGSPS